MPTFSTQNTNKPAPKWWRKLENGLLMVLIPAMVAILMGWGFQDEAFANKLILLINTGLVALIKFIGMMLANGEEYSSVLSNEFERDSFYYPTKNDFPASGTEGTLYYDASTDLYWEWKNGQYIRWVGPRPPKPPKPL